MRVLRPVDRRRLKESDSVNDTIDIGEIIALGGENNSSERDGEIPENHKEKVDLDEIKGEIKVAHSDSLIISPHQGETCELFKRYDCNKTTHRVAACVSNEEATPASLPGLTEYLRPEFPSTTNREQGVFPASRTFHNSDGQPCASLQLETLHSRTTSNKRTLSGARKETKSELLAPSGTAAISSVASSPFHSIEKKTRQQNALVASSTELSSQWLTLRGQQEGHLTAAASLEVKPERVHPGLFVVPDSAIILTHTVPVVTLQATESETPRSSQSSTEPDTMAVGGRFPRKDDDEDSSTSTQGDTASRGAPRVVRLHPVENEPPTLQNHPAAPFSIEIVNDQDVLDPASDDERELPESLQGCNEANMKPASDEKVALDDDLYIQRFNEALKKQGLEIVQQEGDGNCLFRAISLQVYGSAENHAEVRERCMDWMARNEEHYSNFVAVGSSETDADAIPVARAASAFQDYVARKRIIGVHGNHAEIQAISELFNRPVEVYTPPTVAEMSDPAPLQPMNFHAEYKTNDPPIRLSFHDGNHYNAIINPLVPTAGLGLGLPGLRPGLADQLQVTKAKTESDQIADEVELQRILKESHDEKDDVLQRVLKETSMDYVFHHKAMALTDLEATNYELEQKALASSMESYFRLEHDRKQKATAPACVLSAGRRRRGSPPPAAALDEPSYSSFASLPSETSTSAGASTPLQAVASLASATATSDSSVGLALSSHSAGDEEYPQTVQELVMNGFELQKVIRAYEFIGDHFDDLLCFLLSSNTGTE